MRCRQLDDRRLGNPGGSRPPPSLGAPPKGLKAAASPRPPSRRTAGRGSCAKKPGAASKLGDTPRSPADTATSDESAAPARHPARVPSITTCRGQRTVGRPGIPAPRHDESAERVSDDRANRSPRPDPAGAARQPYESGETHPGLRTGHQLGPVAGAPEVLGPAPAGRGRASGCGWRKHLHQADRARTSSTNQAEQRAATPRMPEYEDRRRRAPCSHMAWSHFQRRRSRCPPRPAFTHQGRIRNTADDVPGLVVEAIGIASTASYLFADSPTPGTGWGLPATVSRGMQALDRCRGGERGRRTCTCARAVVLLQALGGHAIATWRSPALAG